MNNRICNKEFLEILEHTFDNGQDFSFVPSGNSMKPMLNGISDSVVLTKKPNVLRKYDVVLFIRTNDNALILHRIIKVSGDRYTLSGDNQYFFDYEIPYCNVVAVMKSFTHKSKVYDSNSLKYKIYSRIIVFNKNLRIKLSRVYHFFCK